MVFLFFKLHICLEEHKKTDILLDICFICWHLPIVPGRLQPSIFGTNELNFCVRYGNRWTLSVINTNYSLVFILPLFEKFIPSSW